MFCFVLTSPPLMLCVYLQTFEAANFWMKKKKKSVLIYFIKIMNFLDVAFLPSKPSFSTTLLKNRHRSESLGTTTCIQTVVGGYQGHVTCEIFLPHKASFNVNRF